MRELLFIVLVLACPLMMILMMRGHGHGRGHSGPVGGCHGGHDHESEPREASTDDLRRRRDELERLIEERGQNSERELTPSGKRR